MNWYQEGGTGNLRVVQDTGRGWNCYQEGGTGTLRVEQDTGRYIRSR